MRGNTMEKYNISNLEKKTLVVQLVKYMRLLIIIILNILNIINGFMERVYLEY